MDEHHSTVDEHEMTTMKGGDSAPPDDVVARRPPPGTTTSTLRMDDAGACLGEKREQAQQRREAGGTDCTTPFKDPLVLDPVKSLSFPAKLHAILSRRDYNDIVSWMPHGRSWRVHQPERFEMQVIPEFFVHCKYSSFIRQANGWGFRRVTKGPDRNSYYHEHFLRGRLHLCRHMRRSAPKDKSSAGGSRKPPDFYKMSEEDPLPEQCDEDGEIAKVSDSSEAATAAGMTVVTRRNMARRLSSLSNKARGTLDKTGGMTGGEDHHHKRQLALVSRPQPRHGTGSEATESEAAVETSKCSPTNGSPIERAARAIEDQRQRRRSILAAEHAAAAVTAAATESRRRVVASMGIDPFPVEAAAASQARMAKAAVAATSSSTSASSVRGIYDPLLRRPSVLSRLSSLDAASSAAPGSLGSAPPTDHPDTSYGRHLLESYSLSRRLSNAGAGTAPAPPPSIHDTARAGVRALLGYHDTGTPLMSSRPPLPATSSSVDHTTASLTLEAAAAAVAASRALHRRPSLGLDPTLLGLGGRGASAADRMDYLDLLRAGAAGMDRGYVNDRGNDGGLPPPLPLPRRWGERGEGRF